jgi:uncharacterized protein (DUF2461 family)
MAGSLMPTTRKTIRRAPRRHITPKATEIFRAILEIEQRSGCDLVCDTDECEVCKVWWQRQVELHRELRLPLWDWPVFFSSADDDPKARRRYDALKAASDAAKPQP